MWVPLMLLALLFIFLVNPSLFLVISMLMVALFIIYKFTRNGKLNFPRFNKVEEQKCLREFVFRSLELESLREVDLRFRFKVSDKLLLVSNSIGFTHVYGALLFHNVRDPAMLKSILLGLPFEYHLIFRGGEGSSESYILLLHVKVGFHNLDFTVSKLVGILNSLSLSIPAESVVILSGDEIISKVLPVVQGVA